jgi:hypothetical protein
VGDPGASAAGGAGCWAEREKVNRGTIRNAAPLRMRTILSVTRETK